jgi:pimeloyl-ACP methyl ester carboxylesterase
MSPPYLMTTLFADLDAPQVQEFLVMPEDPDALATAIADSVWALGTTGKFVWPIPDKGLKKRIHRVAAETLIIWGEHDRLVSPVYAQEFAGLIPGSRVEIIEGAGHVPQWEQLDTVQPLVRDFLGA